VQLEKQGTSSRARIKDRAKEMVAKHAKKCDESIAWKRRNHVAVVLKLWH
jgi:hypothetical protein